MAQASLTVRRTCRADTKVEHSEPTFRIRCGWRLTDKSYSRDNRLVPPKSSYRRRSSAPRCRLTLSWWWRSCQGFSCSLIKKVRELGSNRWEVNYELRISNYELNFRQFEPIEENKTVLIWDKDRVYCGTLTAAYNLLYEKFTYIGEILLFFVEDNTEGISN